MSSHARFLNIHTQPNGATPEFYDDDIPLLYLGAETPAIYLDDDDDLPMGLYYGLLLAAGMPSEHTGLKRSARHSMNLLKWLLLDYKDEANQQTDLNIFAKAFLALPVQYYRHMQLNLHVTGDDRGGAKEDACQIIVLILCRHTTEDQESPMPVLLEELVTTPQSQQAYDLWSARSATLTVQQAELIKKNTMTRQAEIAMQQRQEAVLNKQAVAAADDLDLILEENSENEGSDGDAEQRKETNEDVGGGAGGAVDEKNAAVDEDSESDDDELDVMAAMRKRQKLVRKELKAAENRGEISAGKGVAATRWEDCRTAREQALAAVQHDTVRESQEAAQEAADREEEKSRIISKDPLGILLEDECDLRQVENGQAAQMELALHEVQEEIQKSENNEELHKKAVFQKESLEALTEKLGGLEGMESSNTNKASILPTNSKFNPILFLTLLHRKTPHKELIGSLDRLSSEYSTKGVLFDIVLKLPAVVYIHTMFFLLLLFSTGKTENQAEQLQNLVRDNFPLFVRCAEGFEEFRRNSETEVGLGVNERIEKLEAIAESSAYQAKKGFKPLLDNTSEVRKVQSALAVLQRVAPILQTPALMRQHIENRRYSQALKTYRRSLVIDDSCNISLLNHVKYQAEECVRDARKDLEKRLTLDKAPLDDLLDGIRDLGELLELDVPTPEKKNPESSVDEKSNKSKAKESEKESKQDNLQDEGIYEVNGTVVNIRDHPPALACLLLQAAHFAEETKTLIDKAADTSQRIYAGESLSSAQTSDKKKAGSAEDDDDIAVTPKTTRGSGNQWKYDVLDARVLSTIKAVDIARLWLPRLVRIGKAAREEEKRRAVKIGHRSRSSMKENHLSSFEVFVTNISPSLTRLVEHAAFCSLGSNTRAGAGKVEMTFGQNFEDKLRTLLRSPLPPSQSTKVGKELAALVELLEECSSGVDDLRPERALLQMSPLDTSKLIGDSAVITIEKRRCIYAFDVCSRACSNRASGSGKFDADALLNCLQNLAEQLSRPEECSNEVEKGCELVIRRCCEGLAGFVRDRGDDARLSAVAECADIMQERVEEVIREASFLTPKSLAVQDVVMEDIMGLESAMFDEYLESIRQNVANSVRVGWLDKDSSDGGEGDANLPPSFPVYLSASLLAIVRCRAQVEQALGDRIRRSEGVLYQHLSMATVADGVVEGICNEVMKRKLTLKVRQADRLANELEFLNNTLKKFLGEDTLSLLDSTLHMVSSKAGRGRDYQGDGPDGLAALEELERLGRVYVLCLGD